MLGSKQCTNTFTSSWVPILSLSFSLSATYINVYCFSDKVTFCWQWQPVWVHDGWQRLSASVDHHGQEHRWCQAQDWDWNQQQQQQQQTRCASKSDLLFAFMSQLLFFLLLFYRQVGFWIELLDWVVGLDFNISSTTLGHLRMLGSAGWMNENLCYNLYYIAHKNVHTKPCVITGPGFVWKVVGFV